MPEPLCSSICTVETIAGPRHMAITLKPEGRRISAHSLVATTQSWCHLDSININAPRGGDGDDPLAVTHCRLVGTAAQDKLIAVPPLWIQ